MGEPPLRSEVLEPLVMNDLTRALSHTIDNDIQSSTTVNTKATRALASRAGDLHLPIYNDKDDGEHSGTRNAGLPGVPSDCEAGIDKACTTAHTFMGGSIEIEVYERFILLEHMLDVVRHTTQKDSEDWCFAPLRMCLVGAGYDAWSKLAPQVLDRYPDCPFDPDQKRAEWDKDNFAARKMCGWPSSLSWIDWADLQYVFPIGKKDTVVTPLWLKVVALFHSLKHLRNCASTSKIVTVIYHGTAKAWEMRESTGSISDVRTLHQQVLNTLRIRSCTAQQAHAPTQALKRIMEIPVRDFLSRVPPTKMPLSMLSGPWVRPQPDPRCGRGFLNHRCRLTGVWKAEGGKVSVDLAESYVMGYEWSFANLSEAQQASQRKFARTVPTTYQQISPFDLLTSCYPNFVFPSVTDMNAVRATFDAILVADLWRGSEDTYDREYPFILTQPDNPTRSDSSNTGKTYVTEVIARAMVPSIPPPIKIKDTNSAPDSRALAETIRTYGTIAMDEWHVIRKAGVLLNESDMQSMCTGQGVNSGRAMENTSPDDRVHLRHPMTASCKAADLNVDMKSRTFGLWMRDLTEKERADGAIIQRVESGKLSLEMRLAAISLAEHDVIYDLSHDEATRRTSAKRGGFRYANTGGIAATLYSIYAQETDHKKCAAAIDTYASQTQKRFDAHIEAATVSGVLSQLRNGNNKIILSVSELFSPEIMSFAQLDDLMDELQALRAARAKNTTSRSNYFRPREIFDAWCTVRGLGDMTIREQLMTVCTELPRDVSELAASRAIGEAFDVYLSEPKKGECAERALPMPFSTQGYVLNRATNNGPTTRYKLHRNTVAKPSDAIDGDSVPIDQLLIPDNEKDLNATATPERPSKNKPVT